VRKWLEFPEIETPLWQQRISNAAAILSACKYSKVVVMPSSGCRREGGAREAWGSGAWARRGSCVPASTVKLIAT
jgi:hypothetical protein